VAAAAVPSEAPLLGSSSRRWRGGVVGWHVQGVPATPWWRGRDTLRRDALVAPRWWCRRRRATFPRQRSCRGGGRRLGVPMEARASRRRPCDGEEAARVEGGSGRLVAGVRAGWRVLLVVAMAGGEACGCR
jgi:hypothetical protein